MTPESIRCLALIAASQARVAGMQAFNAERQSNGYALAYDESAFLAESQNLENLAMQVMNQ